MRLTIIGLTITSSWGNGHATVFRSLVRALTARGHHVTFLEHDKPWYANHRDLPEPPWGTTALYDSVEQLQQRHAPDVRDADAVIVGSYVPEGVAVGDWALRTARGPVCFYDIDTPVTLAALERGACEYLAPELIQRYRVYLSFTGGPILDRLKSQYGSPAVRPLYCCFDPDGYRPDPTAEPTCDLSYMGTYSDDRQPRVNSLLLEPARRWDAGRFVVAGPQYPEHIQWPANVQRREHVPPADHRAFYNASRFTLNVTRDDMIAAGYAPSVRLFEAAACGTPIISDRWDGIETFFRPGEQIFLVDEPDQVLQLLRDLPEADRTAVGQAARDVAFAHHTADQRAGDLERHLAEAGVS
jgi:spore maturation protein CgeB